LHCVVEQAERVIDHARVHVVVHGQRLATNRGRTADRVGTLRHSDLTEALAPPPTAKRLRPLTSVPPSRLVACCKVISDTTTLAWPDVIAAAARPSDP